MILHSTRTHEYYKIKVMNADEKHDNTVYHFSRRFPGHIYLDIALMNPLMHALNILRSEINHINNPEIKNRALAAIYWENRYDYKPHPYFLHILPDLVLPLSSLVRNRKVYNFYQEYGIVLADDIGIDNIRFEAFKHFYRMELLNINLFYNANFKVKLYYIPLMQLKEMCGIEQEALVTGEMVKDIQYKFVEIRKQVPLLNNLPSNIISMLV